MTRAAAVHAATLTLDSHIDIPWPDGADPFGATSRRVDFAKMRAGGLDAGCFVAFVPQTTVSPEGMAEAGARARAMLDTIAGFARRENGHDVRMCTRADEIVAARSAGAVAVVPAVENLYAIGDDPGALAEFRARGVVYMTLTHNGHNQIADSAHPRADLGDDASRHGGLSPLGRAAVAEMNRLGILVDVSHASRQTMLQALSESRAPTIASHSCVRALCDHPRNLDDMQLDALRDTRGVVQITAMPPFLRPKGRIDTVAVRDFVDHIDYVVARCGIAHCGISSDFDGGGAIDGWRDASESGNITAELVSRGYGDAQIAALWGGNFLRVMREAEAFASD